MREISHSKVKTKPRMAIPNMDGRDLKFDCFSISEANYKELVEKYGMDVVAGACVRLDEFIREHSYVPYKAPKRALDSKFIKEELVARAKEDYFKKKKPRVNIEDVKTKEDAKAFIESTPSHLRSLDDDCIKLKEEYKL